jgi:hypothetical protein
VGGNQAHHATRHRRDQRRRWAVETSSRWRRFRIHSDGDSLSRRWAAGGACSLRGTRSSPASCSSARCAANREKRELERAVLRQREAGTRSTPQRVSTCLLARASSEGGVESSEGGVRLVRIGSIRVWLGATEMPLERGSTPHTRASYGGRKREHRAARSTHVEHAN